jgi:transcriptional regulator with XRE-family HTH domain
LIGNFRRNLKGKTQLDIVAQFDLKNQAYLSSAERGSNTKAQQKLIALYVKHYKADPSVFEVSTDLTSGEAVQSTHTVSLERHTAILEEMIELLKKENGVLQKEISLKDTAITAFCTRHEPKNFELVHELKQLLDIV